ncbi:Transcriptional regulator, PaaX family protein [Microbacterium sp. C448]|uniref:PaaX family transcriptional regulator n=1 Tax=Microbacterium TaxID=33882 RepID=UPI0003DE663B|nr:MULTISPECIES: PaaX family transcriptional regulator C-terminal domain-containing protein [Microbacterium]MDO8384501.1 PaaX family transcriptional regulator C-terminal domain-containing protein [Microbacterium sp.]CDJ98966.1 Transcriptional regulator, PaaX family protein [Microbacterium sp. C448]
MRARQPKQLLLSLLGEFVLDRVDEPVRASVLLDVLEGAAVAPPATRATLDRMARRGLLERVKVGREIAFCLLEDTREVLREAAERVHATRPFDPQGTGWTLVTFSLPEGQRSDRYRLRATLAWEGFAPLRDGLWLAPGEVDLVAALEPLRDVLPANAVTAFRAEDLPAYPVSQSVREAWDIAAIRAEHERFLETWSEPGARDGAGAALPALVCLVTDWIVLLRTDPRLPAEFMGPAWPAERTVRAYRARRAELAPAAQREFEAMIGRSLSPSELTG